MILAAVGPRYGPDIDRSTQIHRDDAPDPRLAEFHAAVEEASGAAPSLPSGADYVDELRAIEGERRREHDRRRNR